MTGQTTIKLPGAELPYGVLSDWKFWVLMLLVGFYIWLLRKR